jgi:hypothetical protein
MKTEKSEVTSHAVQPCVKSVIRRDGPNALTAIRGLLGLKYQPPEKATTFAYCSEN